MFKEHRIPLTLCAALVLPVTGLFAQDSDDPVYDLDPFEVNTETLDAYNPGLANTGTIVAMERSAIPFTTSVLTSSLINDLQIDNPSDLVQFIAGVSQDDNPYITDNGSGTVALQYRVRGFASRPLYNGFQTGPRILGVDNIGRVEVSKGPNAVLYGQAPAGGIINFVPKMPQSTSHASLMVGLGSNSWERAKLDLGTPMKLGNSEEDNAGLRIGGGYTAFDRDEPFFEAEIKNMSGAFTWDVSERIKLDIQAEYNQMFNVPSRTAAFVSTGSGPDRVVDPFNRDRNLRAFTYGGPNRFIERDAFLSTAYLTMFISDSIRLRVGGFYSTQDEENLNLLGTFGLGTNETVSGARYSLRDTDRVTRAYKVDLLHTAVLKNFTLDSVLGFHSHDEESDTYEIDTDRIYTVSIPFSRPPLASDFPAAPGINEFNTVDEDNSGELSWTNLRFTQILRGMENDLTILWGVAYGEGDTETTDFKRSDTTSEGDDTTYTLGLSYRFLKDQEGALNDAVFFANTSSSFNIQSGNQQNPADFNGFATVDELRAFVESRPANPIEPQTGVGYEAGVRLGMFENKLDLTLTYFDQSRENIARAFFVRESNAADSESENVLAQYLLAAGKENAKGIEIAFEWRASDSLRINGEATFMDGEVVSNPEAPEEEGFGLVRSPDEMISFYAMYKPSALQRSSTDGLEVGLGYSYNSSTRIAPNPRDRFRVSDSYSQLQAMLRYNYEGYAFALNITNVLDDEWVNESNWLSEGTAFKFTVSKEF